MKKVRSFSVLFCLIMLVSVFSGITASAKEEASCGDDATYSIDGDGMLSISGRGAIKEKAFYGREDIKAVFIDEEITEIGASAFCGCVNMEKINIPESVTKLGEYCFAKCASLESIVIPAGVRDIPDYCFLSSKMEKIVLPSRLFSIGKSAMSGCTALKEITISANVGTIGDNAFADCTELTAVICDNDMPAELGNGVFDGCDKLAGIGVPSTGIESYRASEKWNAFKLYSINEKCGEDAMAVLNADGLMIISGSGAVDAQAFMGRSDIRNVVIGEGITALGDSAFRDCSSIETIELPESLTKLGDYCFASCRDVQRLELPDGIAEIPLGCFTDCDLTAVKLPASLEIIYDNAFNACKDLENIRIPETVKLIGERAFGDCGNLGAVICEAQEPPKLEDAVFENCAKLQSVGVPAAGEKSYAKADQWGDFDIIPFVSNEVTGSAFGGSNVWMIAVFAAAVAAGCAVIAVLSKKKKNEN